MSEQGLGKMSVQFIPTRLFSFYVANPDSDLDEIYDKFENYFGDSQEWIIQGTHDEIEKILSEHIWEGCGDLLLHRYLNSKLAIKL